MSKVSKGSDSSEELTKILGDIGGKKSGKLSKTKKIIIAVIALILVAAIVIGVVLGVKAKKNDETEPVYREYTAARGDIVVGLTESSVITLNKETVDFPVGAEVLEVYVKSGAQVNEGDELMKLSTEDIAEALDDYESEIETAAMNLENAVLSKETELLKAEQTLESNLLGGTLSEDEYSSAITQAELDLEAAQNSLTDAQDNYDETYENSQTFTADKAKLTYYEEKTDTYQSLVDYWNDQNSEYNDISSELNQVKSEIKSIADASNMEQAEAILDELKTEYEEMYDRYYNDDSADTSSVTGQGTQQSVKYSELLKAEEKVETLEDSMDNLQSLFNRQKVLEAKIALYDEDEINDKLADAQEHLTESKEDYNEFNEDFTETYGKITTKEEMDDAVSDASDTLDKAKLNLEKQQSAYETALLSAKQKKENTQSTAENAQQEYELTKLQLNQKVEQAQKQYDSLVEELNEIKETVGNDGIVTAPCSGIISSLNVEVGDEISVSSEGGDMAMSLGIMSASLMTITDMSEVNVSISISEDEILDVSLGQEAVVSLASFPDETFDAVVDSISVEGATIGAATVTYTVNVKFNQSEYELYDGMSADVTLVQGSARDVIYINEQAVSTNNGASTVLVKGADGNGVETPVTTGFSDGQFIEIVSGLNEGDVVLAQSALGSAGVSNNKDSGMPDMGGETPDMGGEMPDMGNMGDFNFEDMAGMMP